MENSKFKPLDIKEPKENKPIGSNGSKIAKRICDCSFIEVREGAATFNKCINCGKIEDVGWRV